MQFFSKGWLVLICLVSVLSAVMDAALPKSKTKTAFSFLYAAVLVYAFVLPLGNSDLSDLKLNFDFLQNEALSSELQNSADETALKAAKIGFETVIKEKLSEKNIEEVTVEAQVRKKDESFALQKAEIGGEFTAAEKEIIRKEIEKLSETEVEIIFKGAKAND